MFLDDEDGYVKQAEDKVIESFLMAKPDEEYKI